MIRLLIALLTLVATQLVYAESTINWKLLPGAARTAKAPADRGAVLFQSACAVCHGAGVDRPGTSSLALKYKGKLPALLEERRDLSAERVRYFIRNGSAMMPQFRKTELSDEDASAIAAYLTRKP